MTVVLVVIGGLGAVSDKFDKHIEKLGTTIRLKVIQKTALLGTFGTNLGTHLKLIKRDYYKTKIKARNLHYLN